MEPEHEEVSYSFQEGKEHVFQHSSTSQLADRVDPERIPTATTQKTNPRWNPYAERDDEIRSLQIPNHRFSGAKMILNPQ